VRFEFESRIVSFCFSVSLFCSENHDCLPHGVQVVSAAWHVTTSIAVGVGDLVQRTEDGRTDRVLGGRAIKRSGGVVCGLHRAHGDKERGFLG
jgi:hypothetical protein